MGQISGTTYQVGRTLGLSVYFFSIHDNANGREYLTNQHTEHWLEELRSWRVVNINFQNINSQAEGEAAAAQVGGIIAKYNQSAGDSFQLGFLIGLALGQCHSSLSDWPKARVILMNFLDQATKLIQAPSLHFIANASAEVHDLRMHVPEMTDANAGAQKYVLNGLTAIDMNIHIRIQTQPSCP